MVTVDWQLSVRKFNCLLLLGPSSVVALCEGNPLEVA